MANGRKPLSVAEMRRLDFKRTMEDIEIVAVHVEKCNNDSVLDMFNARNGLQLLSDRELIGLADFVTANHRLLELGTKFKNNCLCMNR